MNIDTYFKVGIDNGGITIEHNKDKAVVAMNIPEGYKFDREEWSILKHPLVVQDKDGNDIEIDVVPGWLADLLWFKDIVHSID